MRNTTSVPKYTCRKKKAQFLIVVTSFRGKELKLRAMQDGREMEDWANKRNMRIRVQKNGIICKEYGRDQEIGIVG